MKHRKLVDYQGVTLDIEFELFKGKAEEVIVLPLLFKCNKECDCKSEHEFYNERFVYFINQCDVAITEITAIINVSLADDKAASFDIEK